MLVEIPQPKRSGLSAALAIDSQRAWWVGAARKTRRVYCLTEVT
jgi:hypothetical protein